MRDRVVQYPNRYKLNPVAGQADTYDLEPDPGIVTEEGTNISKATLLSDATAAAIGLDLETATVDEALRSFFRLTLTFGIELSGKAFSVVGGDFTHSGIVPAGLTATVAVPEPNTTYTVTCEGLQRAVTTKWHFGIYPLAVGALAGHTWAVIKAMSEVGSASLIWQVGDEKDITLATGEVLTLQIYGFNHDDKVGGGKAGITFGLKNLMADTRAMNATNTNVGGFTGSEMYAWLNGTLYNSLPTDLKSLITPVNKKTSAGDTSPTINTNSMKIFLFSEAECFSAATSSFAGEGSQYPVFTDNASRIKMLANGAGGKAYWRERSPGTIGNLGFCCITGSGADAGTSNMSQNASTPRGVCFGFCL